MEEERNRIDAMQKWLLIGVAVVGDTLQIVINATTIVLFPVPVVGQAALVVGWFFNFLLSFTLTIVFFVWFRVLNVSLLGSHKRVVAKLIAIIAEMIPLPTTLFPFWTMVIVYQVHHIRQEDKKYNEERREATKQQLQKRAANDNEAQKNGRNLSRMA